MVMGTSAIFDWNMSCPASILSTVMSGLFCGVWECSTAVPPSRKCI